ncbi:hypothetical protein Cgig2_027322 [Carnegiea gigantea]|uniref:CHCH domain-containing protein n=1 Tax=Carnegiea gigantea TaxID=171969 RepID=A0A9Q1JFT1_9CARY|nr:hypothetical protein Cgig2_027322 [Carnegiea gigantea]
MPALVWIRLHSREEPRSNDKAVRTEGRVKRIDGRDKSAGLSRVWTKHISCVLDESKSSNQRVEYVQVSHTGGKTKSPSNIGEYKDNILAICYIGGAFGGTRGARPVPPEKGVFPLDHMHECDMEKKEYLACLKTSGHKSEKCRQFSKKYLECRMVNSLTISYEQENQERFTGAGPEDTKHERENESLILSETSFVETANFYNT